MKMDHLWEKAKDISIQTSAEIVGDFDVGFDDGIPDETKDALKKFVYWVEDNYHLPVTLWVDFKNRHYLMSRQKKRMGYLFYWVDFADYPIFENPDDIPVIELPVRLGRCTMDDILISFIQAITCYFAWLSNEMDDAFTPDDELVNSIFEAYKASGRE